VFEDSPIGLEKWLPAAWLLSNCKNGISSYELARDLGVTQKSAWFMLHRIRTAMKDMNRPSKIGGPESGPVEVDEAFVGGKVGNMHKGRVKAMRAQMPADRADGYEAPRYDNKAIVVGMFDRESRQVRAKVIPNTKRETLQREILSNVKYGSKVYTDSAVGYDLLRRRYVHETVNHAETYVNGQVHTNSLENFWSLMKRNLSGTYVAVEPFHLDRYLDEQLFRFNNRINTSDEQRFRKVVGQLAGRRLTYADLTGKEAGAEIF
jgi:transposase-like protein